MKSLSTSRVRHAALLALALLSASSSASAQSARGRRADAVPATESAAQAQAVNAGFVNINTATADELQRLPGIGPSKAQAIVATRQRMGRFARVEDILRVRGIGRATLRRLQPMLRLDGATTLAAQAAHVRASRNTPGHGAEE